MVRYRSRTEDMNDALTHHRRYGSIILVLTCVALVSIGSVYGADSTSTAVYKKDLTIADLPRGVEQRVPPGASKEEFHNLLGRQPKIVIDGATLSITAPPQGSSRTLTLSRLELLHGAKIVTNGVNLEIDAELFVSDGGEIVSFYPNTNPTSVPQGANGASGFSAGTLVLDGTMNGNDILRISLIGQDGQAGGHGMTGSTGVSGTRGDNGADHLFDCAHGGGNGGNGAQGGKGGQGGAGGAGGNGGRLILRDGIASQRVQVDFSAEGGKGGKGGPPGNGGPGGPGGPGGSGTTYCRGGQPGSSGPVGPAGEFGPDGPFGQRGGTFTD
jgi:hypothetical protein